MPLEGTLRFLQQSSCFWEGRLPHTFQKLESLESRLRRQFGIFRRKIVGECKNYQFCNKLDLPSHCSSRKKHTSWFVLPFYFWMMHFLHFWLIYALFHKILLSQFTHFFRRFFRIGRLFTFRIYGYYKSRNWGYPVQKCTSNVNILIKERHPLKTGFPRKNFFLYVFAWVGCVSWVALMMM